MSGLRCWGRGAGLIRCTRTLLAEQLEVATKRRANGGCWVECRSAAMDIGSPDGPEGAPWSTWAGWVFKVRCPARVRDVIARNTLAAARRPLPFARGRRCRYFWKPAPRGSSSLALASITPGHPHLAPSRQLFHSQALPYLTTFSLRPSLQQRCGPPVYRPPSTVYPEVSTVCAPVRHSLATPSPLPRHCPFRLAVPAP